MSYLSLYRKYRPKTFKDVIGQEYIVQILKNSIKNNAVANAYVFAGTKGTGKTSIAKIYANAINCLNNKDGDICGNCEICKDFASNQVLDVLELDAASNNGVDEIRKITDAVSTLPTKLGKKVYILDEAHMLTTSAWNALLKVVEEPPKHVIFIFATTEMHKIPATILSRCQCLRFNKITNSEITKLLVKVSDNEKFKYDLEALKVIAEIADGSARDALSILEQTATFTNNNINVQDVYKIYGLLSPKETIDFLNLIASKQNNQVFAKSNSFYQSGINFVSLANMIVSVLTDKLIYLKTKNQQLLTKTNETIINQLQINDLTVLLKLLDIWQETYTKIIAPTDVHVIFDHALIKSMASFDSTKVAPTEYVEKKVEVKKTQPKAEEETFVEPKIEVKDLELPRQKEVKQETKKVGQLPTIQDILFATVSNKDKKSTTDAKKFLNDIKGNIISEKSFTCLTLAADVFCASKESIVLVFKDELDAKILNKMAFSQDFILSTCKVFRNPRFIVGYSIEQLNKQKADLLNAMKEKREKLDLDALRQILNKDETIEQIAFNTIYSKLDEKDRK